MDGGDLGQCAWAWSPTGPSCLSDIRGASKAADAVVIGIDAINPDGADERGDYRIRDRFTMHRVSERCASNTEDQQDWEAPLLHTRKQAWRQWRRCGRVALHRARRGTGRRIGAMDSPRRSAITVDAWLTVRSTSTPNAPITIPATSRP